MGMKESMMDNMMGKMTKEEKSEMMEKMMGKFFEGMSEEDKQGMMQGMMGKMFEGGSPMGGMMKMMMGGGGKGGSPMDMCRKMMESMNETRVTAQYATPELRGLFEEWVLQLEEEVLKAASSQEKIDVTALSNDLSLKEESIRWVLSRLAQQGKIQFAAK